jgi:hypothetical protein
MEMLGVWQIIQKDHNSYEMNPPGCFFYQVKILNGDIGKAL